LSTHLMIETLSVQTPYYCLKKISYMPILIADSRWTCSEPPIHRLSMNFTTT